MKLETYLQETGETQHEFAAGLGVSQSLVSQWLRGVAPPPVRCVEIERHTLGRVTRKDLREDWAAIWPELAMSWAWEGWGTVAAVPRVVASDGRRR